MLTAVAISVMPSFTGHIIVHYFLSYLNLLLNVLTAPLIAVVNSRCPIVQRLIDEFIHSIRCGHIIHVREKSGSHFSKCLFGITSKTKHVFISFAHHFHCQNDSFVMPPKFEKSSDTYISVTFIE
jgi:hypothetical protein